MTLCLPKDYHISPEGNEKSFAYYSGVRHADPAGHQVQTNANGIDDLLPDDFGSTS